MFEHCPAVGRVVRRMATLLVSGNPGNEIAGGTGNDSTALPGTISA